MVRISDWNLSQNLWLARAESDSSEAASLSSLAEQLASFLKSGGERRAALPGGPNPGLAVRAQVLSLGTKLFQSKQFAPIASLVAIAGPLGEDPTLLFLRVS